MPARARTAPTSHGTACSAVVGFRRSPSWRGFHARTAGSASSEASAGASGNGSLETLSAEPASKRSAPSNSGSSGSSGYSGCSGASRPPRSRSGHGLKGSQVASKGSFGPYGSYGSSGKSRGSRGSRGPLNPTPRWESGSRPDHSEGARASPSKMNAPGRSHGAHGRLRESSGAIVLRDRLAEGQSMSVRVAACQIDPEIGQ